MKNLLLISGGLDSMVIYYNYKEEIDKCIYIDYRKNHPARNQELEILKKNNINPVIIPIENLKQNSDGFYFGRNLKMLLAVREMFCDEDICVFIGNTANDNFSDNTRNFFYQLENVINQSYPMTIRIICPLENRTKKSLAKEAKEKKINYYFCDTGGEKPCGTCHSCKAMKEIGYL